MTIAGQLRWSEDASIHPYAHTRTHWHYETLTSFSWLSLAHTLAPIQRFELAGARHGAGAAPQPQGALAAHSQGVPPSRLRATPWLGATPPSQRPRGPPRRRRTSHDACSAALRNRARPLARATPATDEEVSGRRTHDLWRRAAHLRARSELLLAGSSTAGVLAIVHFGSVGRLCGLFERSKAT